MNGALFVFFLALTVQCTLAFYGIRVDGIGLMDLVRGVLIQVAALISGYHLEAMLRIVFGKGKG